MKDGMYPSAVDCPECGLHLNSSELLVPSLTRPRWSVEFARRQSVPAAIVRTMVASIWPRLIWTRLRMRYEIHWSRLGLYVLILLMMLPLTAYGVTQTSLAVATRLVLMEQTLAEWEDQIAAALRDLWREHNAQRRPPPQRGQGWPADAERQEERVRRYDEARAKILALRKQRPTFEFSIMEAIIEAIFRPAALQSDGVIIMPDGRRRPYTAPAWIGESAGGGQFGTIVSAVTPGALLLAVPLAEFALSAMVVLLMPLCFVLVPTTRRARKVRWAHLWRIAAYSAVLPHVAFLFILLMRGVQSLIGRPIPGSMYLAVCLGAVPLLTLFWWRHALHHYLKLPHSYPLAASMAVLSGLLVLGGTFLLAPEYVLTRVLMFR